jgi:hypothetical protein
LDSYGPLIGVWKDMIAAAPVVPVGREEIARIIQDSVWADDATEFTNFLHGTDDAADAIIAALRPTDTGRVG